LVVLSTIGLKPDLNRFDWLGRQFETKHVSSKPRPSDLEVAAQCSLVAFKVEQSAIVRFELPLD
jgi:hypothetical protein